MKKSHAAVLWGLIGSVCVAGNFDYIWNASAPSSFFGDGKVGIDLDGSMIFGMSVNTISGDTVSFSGDPMSFSGGAAVRIAGGLLHFGNGIDVSGDIAFVRTAPQHWIATDVREGGLYGDEFTVVLENADLNDIEISAAYLNGKATGGDSNGNAQPYHVMRGEAWMEVQLQQCLGTTKVVKIRLEQDGSDIKAKILYARFVRSQNAIGEDFDNPSGNFTIESTGFRTTEGTPVDYYGCSKLFFTSRERIADVRVSGPFTCSGTVDIASEMKLSLVNQENAKVAKLSLPDGATFAVSTDGSGPVETSSVCEHGYVPKSAWSVFARNRNLKDIDIDSISGTLGGRSLSWTPVEAWVGYFRWVSDTVLAFQFQYKAADSSLTKGVWAKLQQSGANVEIIAINGYYYEGDVGTKSFESESVSTYASSGESNGYCILSFAAAFNRPYYASCVTLIDGGAAKGGKIVIAGSSEDRHAELRVTNRAGLPTNGVVSVGRYGVLSLINADTYQGVSVADGTCDIHVEAGGKFRQGGDKSFSENLSRNRQSVIIDGGEAEFGCECSKSSSSVDSVDTSGSTYLNFLTLRNGARCYGKAVRLGNVQNAKWTVEGSSPSFWETDISMLGQYNDIKANVTFDVADVTSSRAIDFTVEGDMKMFNPSDPDQYKMLQIQKTGNGTMKVNGVTDFKKLPLIVSGGTWMVGAHETMSQEQNIQLDGGAFAADTGVHAAVGTLAIGISDCGIIAGEGAAIVFLDSSAVAWGGGRVDVECSPGSVVRFGDSSSALTASQQRKLYLNGARAKLDANGFVVLKSGFAISLR